MNVLGGDKPLLCGARGSNKSLYAASPVANKKVQMQAELQYTEVSNTDASTTTQRMFQKNYLKTQPTVRAVLI